MRFGMLRSITTLMCFQQHERHEIGATDGETRASLFVLE